jgi:hypothetical protein
VTSLTRLTNFLILLHHNHLNLCLSLNFSVSHYFTKFAGSLIATTALLIAKSHSPLQPRRLLFSVKILSTQETPLLAVLARDSSVV